MSHETPVVNAEPRERTGTRYAQRLRSGGRLPAVIYGHKTDPVHVSVDEKEILSHLKHGTHVMNVEVAGGKSETCLVKDLQFGYLGDNVIHVDFARVDLDEEVTVNVHITFFGEPAEASKPGAILSHNLTELEVRCKVNAIPDEIKVDLMSMESSITVGEVELPAGVECTLDASTTVASITYVKREDDATGEEAEAAGGAAEPEVITEAKPKDEDEG